jgi:hypothetical protein
MKTEVIAQMLVDAGLGTLGTDVFFYSMPENHPKGILVIDNPEGTPLDENLPGYKKDEFRVIVRDSDYLQAMATAKQVMTALDIYRETHGVLEFKRMKAYTDPIAFMVPLSDTIEVAVNMCAYYCDFS